MGATTEVFVDVREGLEKERVCNVTRLNEEGYGLIGTYEFAEFIVYLCEIDIRVEGSSGHVLNTFAGIHGLELDVVLYTKLSRTGGRKK